jgi:hypothetical protein
MKAGVFFDVTYFEFGLDYVSVLGGIIWADGDVGSGSEEIDETINYLALHAYFKYPFPMGRGGAIFPMVGIEYLNNLTYESSEGVDLSDEIDSLDEFWVKGGIGWDVNISPASYFRITGLIGYKLNSTEENDMVDFFDTYGVDASFTGLDMDLGVGVGFRL